MSDLPARFLASLGPSEALGLAVSGGGDSIAMLHLAVACGLRPAIVTVNHGLRAEAAAEAEQVGVVASALGLSHTTLLWQGWDHSGNLQDEARKARRRLIAAWAVQNNIATVALGHTQNDIAETLVMRLQRGAGVDGLAAMAAHWPEGGILWQRPLLGFTRSELRQWLQAQGKTWVEDPSNDNPRFDRVRARKAMAVLQPLGVTPARLAQVAAHLAEARTALDALADDWAVQTLREDCGTVTIAPALWSAPAETQRRVLQRVLLWIAPAEYAPRGSQLGQLLARLSCGQAATLAGVRFLQGRGGLRALREAKAAAPRCAADQIWDGRWQVVGDVPDGAELGPLDAAGLAQCPDWRSTGLPRAALLASPAVWLGERLVAAPLAGFETASIRALPLHPLLRAN
ncbi:MAG: tRNA lysidine(34) synthetase TilS [Pseudomonadota bacterium]